MLLSTAKKDEEQETRLTYFDFFSHLNVTFFSCVIIISIIDRTNNSQKVQFSRVHLKFLHLPTFFFLAFLHVVTRVRGHGTGGREVVGGRRDGRDSAAGRVVVSHRRASQHKLRLSLCKII